MMYRRPHSPARLFESATRARKDNWEMSMTRQGSARRQYNSRYGKLNRDR